MHDEYSLMNTCPDEMAQVLAFLTGARADH